MLPCIPSLSPSLPSLQPRSPHPAVHTFLPPSHCIALFLRYPISLLLPLIPLPLFPSAHISPSSLTLYYMSTINPTTPTVIWTTLPPTQNTLFHILISPISAASVSKVSLSILVHPRCPLALKILVFPYLS